MEALVDAVGGGVEADVHAADAEVDEPAGGGLGEEGGVGGEGDVEAEVAGERDHVEGAAVHEGLAVAADVDGAGAHRAEVAQEAGEHLGGEPRELGVAVVLLGGGAVEGAEEAVIVAGLGEADLGDGGAAGGLARVRTAESNATY